MRHRLDQAGIDESSQRGLAFILWRENLKLNSLIFAQTQPLQWAQSALFIDRGNDLSHEMATLSDMLTSPLALYHAEITA